MSKRKYAGNKRHSLLSFTAAAGHRDVTSVECFPIVDDQESLDVAADVLPVMELLQDPFVHENDQEWVDLLSQAADSVGRNQLRTVSKNLASLLVEAAESEEYPVIELRVQAAVEGH
jgi:hypothetical protein